MLTYHTQIDAVELARESYKPLSLHPFALIISRKSYGVPIEVHHAWMNEEMRIWDIEYTIPRGENGS